MNIASILEKIIKKNSTLSPIIVIDESGVYEEYFGEIENVRFLESSSNISLTKTISNDDVNCIYLRVPTELSGMITSGKVKKLNITPETLLNEVSELKGKIKGEIQLSENQKVTFLKNFNKICTALIYKESIDDELVKKEILLHIEGKRVSSKGLLLQMLNGEVAREQLVKMDLLALSSELINKELSISMNPYHSYENLLAKVMVTYSKNEYMEYGGASMNDYLLDVSENDISCMARFIMDNADELRNPISELDDIYKDIEPVALTYAVPRLFVKYVGKHIGEPLEIANDKLWTEKMRVVGAFITETISLDESLAKNINYQCAQNNIEFMFDEYKRNFSYMDSSYRRVEAYYEKLVYLPDFYLNTELHTFVKDIKKKYHSVIARLNGRIFQNYNQYMAKRKDIIKQSEFITSRHFNKRTLFILADGFRYEMAHELIQKIKGYEIEDVNVIGELPSETEIGMNSYFIIDEKIALSDKNVFVLKKDGKLECHIYEWRRNNLAKKLGCNVIPFEVFKKYKDYTESVIYFFDEADINMHHFDSASKMSEAIDNLEKVIRYALEREYDVVLLSDHGYVDIEKRLEVQDNTISIEKKKSRYLILNKNEEAKEMYYNSEIHGADYLVMGDKKLCFINSTNSLRETSKYNHGGISFQENVITCFIIHGVKEKIEKEQKVIFEMIKAYNEITGKIRGAMGYVCNIMSGADFIFNVMIDVDEYQLHVPVRQYDSGTDFLIMVSNGESTEKIIVKKEGGRVLDKDLDIFS